MKIVLEYFNEDRYKLAKQDLQDPDMALSDLGLTVRYNNYDNEIIIDDYDLHEIVRLECARTFLGIYFVNGNCFEDLHQYCNMEVRFK